MARIVAAFGIQGWVKLKTFTEAADGLANHAPWWVRVSGEWRSMSPEVIEARPAGTVAKLQGVDDRNGAEALKGADVAVAREALGEAEEGSIFWIDLVGLEVVSAQGASLGRVKELFQTGETSVLVVSNGRERMIPFVPLYVKAVDREAGRIVVDWEAEYDV